MSGHPVLRFVDGPWQGHTIDWRRPGEAVPQLIHAVDRSPGFDETGSYIHIHHNPHDPTTDHPTESYQWQPQEQQ